VTKFVTLPVSREKLSSALQQHRLFPLRPFLEPGRMKAMQLKHLNLTTSDVPGLAAFFERFIGFKRFLERGPGAFTILGNDEDFVLTLMKAKKHTRQATWKLSMSAFTSTIQLPCTASTMNWQQPVYLQEKSRVTATCVALISIAPLPATSLSKSPHHQGFDGQEAASVGGLFHFELLSACAASTPSMSGQLSSPRADIQLALTYVCFGRSSAAMDDNAWCSQLSTPTWNIARKHT
jgi:hypothetical protein